MISQDRGKHLVNSPGSVAPQTELKTAPEIRKALERNIGGGNYGVYCVLGAQTRRVYGVRVRKGTLEVEIGYHEWSSDFTRVYKEG